MKKLTALLMVLILTLSVTVSAMAAYDFSFVEEYPNLFSVSKDDDGTAFIDTISVGEVADYSFTHPYESDDYYSYLYNDLIVIDYATDDAYSVWRLWIEYRGTKALKAQSVDLIFDGHTFTFSDVYKEENMEIKDNGDFSETYMLKFGPDSLSYLEALETYVNRLTDCDSPFDGIMNNGEMTMVLHGTDEDLTFRCPTCS